jgi:hypothetical protein
VASRSKTKTTMAKLNRERKVLEKRAEKQARKDHRKQAARMAEEDDATRETPADEDEL